MKCDGDKMARCSSCGARLDDGVRFCPNCGANIYRVSDRIPEEKAEENKKHAESYTTEHDTQTQSEVIDVDAREFRYAGDAPVRQKVNMLCLIGPAIAVPGLISIFNVLGLGAIIVSIIGYLKAERLEQKGKEAAVFGIILGATELGVMLARLFF